MKHLKTYKLFESRIEDMEDVIKDILLELEDLGLQIEMDRTRKDGGSSKTGYTNTFVEVRIIRPSGSPDRVIPGVTQPPSGKYPGNLFFWYEVKDAIIRLNEWYYDYSGNEYTPAGARIGYREIVGPFRMFSSGVGEFGIGWHKPEDFDGLGDFISFSSLRIEMKV
jgi:hypothetical protein